MNMLKTTSSEATTTFYCSKQILSKSNLDLAIVVIDGKRVIIDSDEKKEWILNNARRSQFNSTTCFIYNRAFKRFLEENEIVYSGCALGTYEEQMESAQYIAESLVYRIAKDVYELSDIEEYVGDETLLSEFGRTFKQLHGAQDQILSEICNRAEKLASKIF